VERWAKSRGATRAFLTTYRGSPTAVPFYEKRMGIGRKFWGSGRSYNSLPHLDAAPSGPYGQ
jgi:hypothetical protein